MIEVVSLAPEGSGTRLRLRPPRALSARQFVLLFAALSGAMWLAAGVGWWAGNAFAPLFALLHSALVGGALRWLWQSGERDEVIAFAPDAVEVRRSSEPDVAFRAHPYWVRLQRSRDGERLMLASSGKRIEIGAFLGPAERRQLAQQLEALLAAARGRDR